MKFAISRTSNKLGEKPCEGCTREIFTGRNKDRHPLAVDVWVIDVNTLEELLSISDAVGYELIITSDMPGIEIYDSYKE